METPDRRSLAARGFSRRLTLRCGVLLIVAAAGPWGCLGTSGNERYAFEARASGVEGAADFTNDLGWRVTLSHATMRLGPIYLNTVAPLRASRRFALLREAHAAAGHLKGGLVVGEILGDVEIDLLSPDPTAFPVTGQITGDAVRTAEIRFWPGSGLPPDARATAPTLVVAGAASRGGETIRFEGRLTIDESWLPSAAPGDRDFLTLVDVREVRGIPAGFTAAEGGSLRVRVSPQRLFASSNFAQIRENPLSDGDAEVRSLVQSSGDTGTTDPVMRSLYEAIRSIHTYDVRWIP